MKKAETLTDLFLITSDEEQFVFAGFGHPALPAGWPALESRSTSAIDTHRLFIDFRYNHQAAPRAGHGPFDQQKILLDIGGHHLQVADRRPLHHRQG